MNMNQFTQKSLAAIQSAQTIASEYGNQQIEQPHLLLALVSDGEGFIPQLLTAMGMTVPSFEAAVKAEVNKLPKVSGSSREADKIYVAQDVDKALNGSEQIANSMHDEYISVEHIFLSLLENANSALNNLFRTYNVTKERVMQALASVRGNQRVTSDNPEETYDALKKYGTDLVERARQNKLANVLSNVQPDTRYTCIAEAYGRYGGHVVVRSDIQTLPQGMASLPLDIMISGSFSQHMMMASAVCRSANAVSAVAALIESDKLEKLLASGTELEALMDKQSSDFLKYETFTEDQMNWFNLNGFVLAYDNAKPSTRYTWILDARMADGFRRVQRTELVTPSQAEQDYLSLQAARSAADKTPAALPLQQVIRMK